MFFTPCNEIGFLTTPSPPPLFVHSKGELDELEREEFFRLKKVQAKKKRDAQKVSRAVDGGGTPAAVPSAVGFAKDEDVVF